MGVASCCREAQEVPSTSFKAPKTLHRSFNGAQRGKSHRPKAKRFLHHNEHWQNGVGFRVIYKPSLSPSVTRAEVAAESRNGMDE